MQLGACSAVGPRDTNEDAFFLRPFEADEAKATGYEAFVLVCDGMGGYAGGELASETAVRAANEALDHAIDAAQTGSFDASTTLKDLAEAAHAAIVAAARKAGGTMMGATYLGAFVGPREAVIGHIGDSRAYLVRDDAIFQLTEDHSLIGRLMSKGVLTEEEARSHPQRNRIDRALGAKNHACDVTTAELNGDDVLVLCSDGVYTALNRSRILELVRATADTQACAESIVQAALLEGTDDNTTVALAFNNVPKQEDTLVIEAPAAKHPARDLSGLPMVEDPSSDEMTYRARHMSPRVDRQ